MDRRARRHTWTHSPEQESSPSNKKRHFSAPNAGASNEPDLLGTILERMKSPKAEVSKWEGQPNYSELGGKKREIKWEDRLVSEKPHNQWWSTDPLQLESSPKMSNTSKSDNNFLKPLSPENVKSFQKFRKAEKSDSQSFERKKLQAKARSLDLTSNNDKRLAKGVDIEWEPPKYLKNKQKNKSNGKKNDERSHAKREKDIWLQVKKEQFKKSDSKKENDSGVVNFDKRRSCTSEKNKAKISESPNGRRAQNADKELKKNSRGEKKYPKEMEGTKSWRSKSSWKGAERLGSTRKAWRPDRAYDFGRNHMEINDVETPNDDFQLARIV